MPITAKVVKLNPSGEGVSDSFGPNAGYVWLVREVAVEAPIGSDGALLWRQNGLIVKVTNVGEFTSEAFAPELTVTNTEPVTIEAVGLAGGGTATVTLNYEQRTQA